MTEQNRAAGADPASTPGPGDALTDVRGLRVGHAQRTTLGWLTGSTVVLAPEDGAVAAVDVRGGGPGTRETDVLDPRNLVQRIDAVLLTGGSAFGLDAAGGVVSWLEERHRGFRLGHSPSQVVPIVPAAVLFDLGRGGDWRARPDAALGREAAEAAGKTAEYAAVTEGSVGAGTGAVAGQLRGGVGTASLVLPTGITVAALTVVNAAGSAVDPATGLLYGSQHQAARPAAVREAAQRRIASCAEESERRAGGGPGPATLNTTLAIVATDAELSPAQAQKLAGTAHDGLARAIRPVHLMTDGDTVFTLATGERPLPPAPKAPGPQLGIALALNGVLAAGADVLARAVVNAVLSASSADTPGLLCPSYRDLYEGS